ncbi:hypothetical protein SACS_1637 [Parasaccharibacter apium]|uniref:Uncharacterized protein n=1 Tax=Parasaccharibacter apium TaxID=1510841 RepID=A0A7U7G735_9PROT|nr:hypothetical protein SACS_1637 [Parasaccharibacter apium]
MAKKWHGFLATSSAAFGPEHDMGQHTEKYEVLLFEVNFILVFIQL